jgi:hypothetical protein
MGIVDSLFFKSGALDNSPMIEFINKTLDGQIMRRHLIAGSVDVETGHYFGIDFDYL